MTADVGRNLVASWKGTNLLGLREKGLALNGEAIDVTSDEDAGVRLLLAASSQDEVDIAIKGVTKDRAIKDDWMTGGTARIGELIITWPDGSTLTGDFRIGNFNETAPYQDAITFDTNLQSTGPWVYAPV